MESYYQRNKEKKRGRKPKQLLNDDDKPIDIQIQEYNRLVSLFFKMKDQKLNTEEIELRIDILKYRLDNNIVLV